LNYCLSSNSGGADIGIHPKIGITGLPRSGKTAVLSKVLEMIQDERRGEIDARGGDSSLIEIIGGMKTEPILEGSERVGFKVIDIKTGAEAVMAHKDIDSRLRVLGYGIDTEALESVALPAIEFAKDYCEVIVIDEIGKFAVESEDFVNMVRAALEVDKPTVLALHKKSRHPLLQDIRRRDDARILEVTPVNRALLPYKIHKLMRETY
jgi:nucleoside-triphosphatase